MYNIDMSYGDVINYFNKKASVYDDVDKQSYWVLSDEFYKKVLQEQLQDFMLDNDSIRLLDAGAGTGRWSLFFDEIFSKNNISGTLVDISDKMLNVAENKIKDRGLTDKFNTALMNIENMNELEDNSFDVSISFYNVLSFVEHPDVALKEIYKKLKKGGIHISVVANSYHALYFAILTGRTEQLLNVLSSSKISFNDLMPSIHCYTPDELKELYGNAGFTKTEVYGGPNFIYPGMEETYITGETKDIASKLRDNNIMTSILEAELKMYRNPDIVGRGNTLFAIATK